MKQRIGPIIDEIENFPATRIIECRCGKSYRISTLLIYGHCDHCGAQTAKLRAFGGIGTELQDLIDAVLKWMGTGEQLELTLVRKKEIDEDD